MSDNQIILTADDATAKPLVAHIRSAVNSAAKYSAYVEAHGVTRENVKHHAAALATLAYPNAKPVQKVDGKRTTYGNAVQAAGAGLRKALGKADNDTVTDYLARVLKAADSANDHEVDAAKVLAAVQEWAKGVLS